MAVAKKSAKDVSVRLFKTSASWDAWLARHFDTSSGLWLRLAKKTGALTSITHQEALEVALCHGWIDGQAKSEGDDAWIQKFTPRGPNSIWSKINRAKAGVLIKEGRMQAGGLAAIARAKTNGRWEAAYDSSRTSAPPEDLVAALARSPTAKAFFATLNSQNRYAILFRIQTAKKAETRQKRIEQFVRMLEKHEKLYP